MLYNVVLPSLYVSYHTERIVMVMARHVQYYDVTIGCHEILPPPGSSDDTVTADRVVTDHNHLEQGTGYR